MKSGPLLIALSLAFAGRAQNFEAKTRVGQQMPAFAITDTTGAQFDMRALTGRVVVVNFWATWCGPCQAEIPRLEKEVWEPNRSSNFVVIGISRGESPRTVGRFVLREHLTYRIAVDRDRRVYRLFADAGIPRNYVVGADGRILFQSMGFDKDEFDRMKGVIAHELAGMHAHQAVKAALQ